MAPRRERRTHNSAEARAAILAAATQAFAQHGFGATHMQAVADAAGYDKSLLFQYFGDKTGLYTAVIESVVRQAIPTQIAATLAELLADPATPHDASKLATLLATLIRGNFDTLQTHTVARRLLTWEAAEGWRSFAQVHLRYQGARGAGRGLVPLLREAQAAGLVHRDLDTAVLVTLLQETSRLYLTELPRVQLVLDDPQLATDAALTRAREQLVRALLRAVLVHPASSEQGEPPERLGQSPAPPTG